MAQYDVFPAPAGRGYVVDVQSDLLAVISTRIVMPLAPERFAPPVTKGLNPVFEIEGARHVLVPQNIASVPTALLKRAVATVADRRDDVTLALDILYRGL